MEDGEYSKVHGSDTKVLNIHIIFIPRVRFCSTRGRKSSQELGENSPRNLVSSALMGRKFSPVGIGKYKLCS